MKVTLRQGLVIVSMVAALGLAFAQHEDSARLPPPQPSDTKLPNGKSQRDEILKAEHADNVRDAAKLADMAQELKEDLEKQDRFVFSLSTLKKTEDIEKLAKKIRSRLRHD
jgi:hypothetical protein